MSDFKPYLVQAAYGGLALLVQSCNREYHWNISKHPTPGTQGDETRHNGRQSITDAVVALCTVPDVKKLVALADKKTPQLWAHPLLESFEGRIENLSAPGDASLYGYFLVSFNVVEHREPGVQTINLGTISAGGTKKKLTSAFDDLTTDMDGLDAIPGQGGTNLNSSWGDLGDSFDAMTDTFDGFEDGTMGWRDLSRSLDVFTEAADVFVDAVAAVEDSVEAVADTLISTTTRIVQDARDAVDAVKTAAQDAVTFVTTAPSNLYSMMIDAGIEMTDAAIVAIMEDNGIDDPLAILPGVILTIPKAV